LTEFDDNGVFTGDVADLGERLAGADDAQLREAVRPFVDLATRNRLPFTEDMALQLARQPEKGRRFLKLYPLAAESPQSEALVPILNDLAKANKTDEALNLVQQHANLVAFRKIRVLQPRMFEFLRQQSGGKPIPLSAVADFLRSADPQNGEVLAEYVAGLNVPKDVREAFLRDLPADVQRDAIPQAPPGTVLESVSDGKAKFVPEEVADRKRRLDEALIGTRKSLAALRDPKKPLSPRDAILGIQRLTDLANSYQIALALGPEEAEVFKRQSFGIIRAMVGQLSRQFNVEQQGGPKPPQPPPLQGKASPNQGGFAQYLDRVKTWLSDLSEAVGINFEQGAEGLSGGPPAPSGATTGAGRTKSFSKMNATEIRNFLSTSTKADIEAMNDKELTALSQRMQELGLQ
ncbi:MAG: hypothetical protein ACE5JI_11915, partial [Acidobacteriota bacterium]